MLNLVFDRCVLNRPYPNLAPMMDASHGYHGMGNTHPFIVPLRLLYYTRDHNYPVNIVYLGKTQLPENSYYPIGLGWFNFELDYVGMLPGAVFDAVVNDRLKILFYYHEGDNPNKIKQRLDTLIVSYQLPKHCYRFVSGNTAAHDIEDFVYFADFELWYQHCNRTKEALPIHKDPRECDFTALNRLHKSWRATVMTNLLQHHVLDNSYWSYCETGVLNDDENPIEIDSFSQLRSATEQFLKSAPYVSDELPQTERNNHANLVDKYFKNSYCHIVLETHFDADQSGGAFLTEKTFKPIKHGQMFFVVGAVGSLQALRDMGYRVFDDILDNSYDLVVNNTQRWIKLRDAIIKAQSDLPRLFACARTDIEHNQQLFVAHKTDRLNILLEQLNESY